MRRIVLATATCALILATLGSSATAGSDWPVYRGPNHDLTAEPGLLDASEPLGLEIAWKRVLGGGYSSVSVASGKAVTMFQDGDKDWLAAFDAESGEELWRVELDATYAGHDGSHDGPISTPLLADGKAFAFTPRGRFLAADLESGEVAWSHDLTAEEFGASKPHYGFTSAPILVDDVVVLEYGVKETSTVSGFDPASGERLWSVGGDAVNHQSPMRIVLDGKEQVLAIGDHRLYGVDARSGELLWEAEHGGDGDIIGSQSTNATPAGDNRFLLTYKQDSGALLELRPGEDGVTVETVWTTKYLNNTYTVPVYHDGFFYGFSNRFMVSIDAETGEPAWKSRRPGDGFLMVLDGHLVILTKRGSLHVARASGEGYEEVAALDLFEDNAWTAPSFADGDLWVRSFGELARVGLGRAASAAPVAEAQPAAPSDSRWAAFLAEVDAAEDKDAAVDAFLESVASFPIVEGETTVHFVYHGDAEDMAIVGDIIEGRHQEPMRRLSGTRLFYYTAEVAPDAAIKYQFVKDFETVLDERNPNRVEAVLFGLEEYSWLKMPGYETPAFLDEPTGPRGRIEVVELPVPELEDTQRTIQVYLPAGYDESDERYPVAYLHGGNQALDRGQWAIALDNLIGRSVRPLIVAFIHPAGEPGYESRPPGAILYGRAFVGQIVPAIDERFRTIASPEGRANVGIGFGGLTAFLTTFNAPGVFGKVSAQSPFMLSSMEDMLRAATPAAADVPLDIYLDWGRYDPYSVVENWNLIESSRRTDQFLRDKGYQPAGGEFSGGYGFPAWRARTGAMLEALFPLEE